jgi:hypothetical protein
LFRTYCPAPALEHDQMGIGLQGFEDDRSINPLHLLAMPFRIPIDSSGQVQQPAPERPVSHQA